MAINEHNQHLDQYLEHVRLPEASHMPLPHHLSLPALGSNHSLIFMMLHSLFTYFIILFIRPNSQVWILTCNRIVCILLCLAFFPKNYGFNSHQ